VVIVLNPLAVPPTNRSRPLLIGGGVAAAAGAATLGVMVFEYYKLDAASRANNIDHYNNRKTLYDVARVATIVAWTTSAALLVTGAILHRSSSESVSVAALPSDIAAYITSTDLPALQGQAGFKLIKQDSVKVGGESLIPLVYPNVAAAAAAAGKQATSTVDRYYVPGTSQLATVSLSTPDGVDNVDAFRQMIESFKWR